MKTGTLGRLLRRADFLAAASKGKKWVAPGVIIQLLPQPDHTEIRMGLTASKKVGGAVERNRTRRRLRALAIELLPTLGLPPCDVVLIAKNTTITRPAADLRKDVLWCISKLKP